MAATMKSLVLIDQGVSLRHPVGKRSVATDEQKRALQVVRAARIGLISKANPALGESGVCEIKVRSICRSAL